MAAPDGVPPARTPRRRPVTALLGTAAVSAGLVAATALTGCSTAREAEARANASLGASTCPVATNDQVTGTIRIGYQAIPNANLLVKDRGWLEACLPHAQVKWMQFDSGGDVVQAFGARSIDIATLGSSPVTKALSAPLNLDVKVVWIDDVIGRAESLVARDASVRSLRQLKGRTITTPSGSTSHYSLLQALAMNGMQAGDVKLVNLSPDKMMAAWQNKQVDAAWVWDPVLSQLTATGHIVTGSDVTAAAGHPTFDLEGATGQFIAANPGFMDTWTAVENHAVQQMSADRAGAVESLAVQLGADPATVRKQVTGYTYPTAKQQVVLDRALPQQLLATAQFLRAQGSIDAVSAPKAYADGVSTTSIQKVGS